MNTVDCSQYLTVVSQDSFGGKPQRNSHNGVAKDMYYVVKNIPFVLKVSTSEQSLCFSDCVAEATLFYDTDESKQVETATGSPVSCRIIPTKDEFLSVLLQIELNVSVLSSHHQNSPFKIRICGRTPKFYFTIWSHSITSVSKPKQVEKCLSKGAQPTKTRVKKSPSKAQVVPVPTVEEVNATGAENPSVLTCLSIVMKQLAEINAKLDNQQQQINALLQMTPSLTQGEDSRPIKLQKLAADQINLSGILSPRGILQLSQQFAVPTTTVVEELGSSDPNNNIYACFEDVYSDDLALVGSEGN